jgi:periplasmic divalent cation tolerance protein
MVFITVPDQEIGTELARKVVEAQLAACGNLIPGLTSIYRWKGEVHQDPECLIILKTTASALPALKRRVVELHPYEVPEFLALAPTEGHLPYLEWVQAEIKNLEGP